MSTSLLAEFTLGYELDTGDPNQGFYLNHRACATIEVPYDSELPTDSANFEVITSLIHEHMKEYHGVVAYDPTSCPSSSEHLLVEFCGNCGYSNRG